MVSWVFTRTMHAAQRVAMNQEACTVGQVFMVRFLECGVGMLVLWLGSPVLVDVFGSREMYRVPRTKVGTDGAGQVLGARKLMAACARCLLTLVWKLPVAFVRLSLLWEDDCRFR